MSNSHQYDHSALSYATSKLLRMQRGDVTRSEDSAIPVCMSSQTSMIGTGSIPLLPPLGTFLLHHLKAILLSFSLYVCWSVCLMVYPVCLSVALFIRSSVDFVGKSIGYSVAGRSVSKVVWSLLCMYAFLSTFQPRFQMHTLFPSPTLFWVHALVPLLLSDSCTICPL